MKQFNWVSLIPQCIVIALLSYFAYLLGLNTFLNSTGIMINIMYGAYGEILLWYIVGGIVAKFHKQGVRLIKQQKYIEAIPFFQESIVMFNKYWWVDKYRYYLVSYSKHSYREKDLSNLAFCYCQIGNNEKAIEYYKIFIEEFPENEIAKDVLDYIINNTKNN